MRRVEIGMVYCEVEIMYLLINSDNEHSRSKRCNNCSGTTFRPRRSSSGTKLRVTGKDVRNAARHMLEKQRER